MPFPFVTARHLFFKGNNGHKAAGGQEMVCERKRRDLSWTNSGRRDLNNEVIKPEFDQDGGSTRLFKTIAARSLRRDDS